MGNHHTLNIVEFLQNLTTRGEELTLVVDQLQHRARKGLDQTKTINTLRQHKAEVVAWLREREATQNNYPLTQGQLGLWLDWQRNPENSAYNLVTVARLHTGVQLDILQQAVQWLVDRHPVLRTIYRLVDDQPMQQAQAQQTAAFTLVDGLGWTQTQIDAWIEAESARPFDLSHGPIMRISLLQTNDAQQGPCHLLHWASHHIATDHFSQEILQDELLTCYRALLQGEQPQLPAANLTYRDFVRWEQDVLQADGARLASFWQTQLGDAPLLLNLPMRSAAATAPNSRQGEASKTLAFSLDATLSAQLRAVARTQQTTLYTLLLAAYQVLISRYTGQKAFFINSPTAVRDLPGWTRTVGYLVNPILLRADLAGDSSFTALLQRTQQTVTAALAHHLYPYHALLRHWHKQIATEQLQQGMVGFIFDPIRQQATDADLFAAIITAGQRGMPEPLTLSLFESRERLDGLITYHTNQFDDAFIARMAGHFQTLLTGIVADPDQRLSDLPLLTQSEHHQLLVEWNDTATDYPKDKCIHRLFEEQVERTPHAVAVVMANAEEVKRLGDWEIDRRSVQSPNLPISQSLTYRELNAHANQLAHHLQSLGVGPETLVGLCVERSIEMVVGLLGILKAGGAYVPLDPTYPAERLDFMLQDANMPVLLTQEHLLAQLPVTTAQVVCLDRDWPLIATQSSTTPVSTVQAEHLAYVIYTSGSTGRPKGVMIEHKSLTNFLWTIRTKPGFTADDILLAVTTLSFDIAGLELYLPLITGGKLVLVDQETTHDGVALARAVIDSGTTVMQATPATWRLLLSAGWQGMPTLKLLCGGEALPRNLAEPLLRCGRELWNLYGPTETTIWSTFTRLCAEDELITIGGGLTRTVANTQLYVLDAALKPVPVGVSGELYIGGDGLARGYLNRPELTKEKFIPNLFDTLTPSPFGAGRLYKTGDLARWLPDGNVEYLGRIDQQVKIRGFRIELGEIESVLSQHPAVREAVVIAREDMPGEKRLVAYVVADKETGDQRLETHSSSDTLHSPVSSLQSQALRSHLQAKLPDYMLPSTFVRLDALPLTPNGKVDRKALPAPLATVAVGSEQTAPRTAAEATLAAIWREVLRLSLLGMDDNFFAIGGHSLLATQVVSRIRQAFQVELPLRMLFQSATVRSLATEVNALQQQHQQALRPAFTPVSRSQPLPLSFAQARMWFLAQMEGSNRAYHIPLALEVTGSLDVLALQQSWQAVVNRHEALRTRYRLLDGAAYQEVLEQGAVDLSVEHLNTTSETSLATWLAERVDTPFDLAADSPWRLHLLQVSDDKHILLLVLHHIAADGWSLDLLWREWSQCYTALVQGQAITLPPLPLHYADYAVWQRQWLQGETLAQHLAFWQQHLTGAPSLLELPTDHPRPAVQSYQGAGFAFTLDAALSQAVEALCVRQGVTPFMTLLTTFQVLLHRYSGQDDIVVGTPIANRTQLETEGMIGMFVNTLALRSHLGGNPTFSRLLSQVRTATQAAYDHQALPFELILDVLRPERSLSHAPLFQVMFILQNNQKSYPTLSGATLRALESPVTTTKFDLTLTLWVDEQGMAGYWEYNTDLFEPATIERMVGHFQNLLQGIVNNPDQPLAQLPLLTEIERHQLLVEWNDTQVDYPQDRCIHHLFEEQVARTPDAVAVVMAEEQRLKTEDGGPKTRDQRRLASTSPASYLPSLTYSELNTRANQLAHYLQSLGVGPETLVGICVERSIEMVVGLLGILKAGGAYVPLDPSYPKERLAFMLQDANTPMLLTQQHLLSQLPLTTAQVVCLDRDWQMIATQSSTTPVSHVQAEHLAYVIYTSGSTGRPKGVEALHRSVMNRCQWMWRQLPFLPDEVACQKTALSFVDSVWEIFGPLVRGVPLVVIADAIVKDPQALVTQLATHQISRLVLVPSLLKMLLESEPNLQERLTRLTYWTCSGEALTADLLQLFQACLPHAYLLNLYGSSEVAGDVTWFDATVDRRWQKNTTNIPIGRPIDNTQIYLLDTELQPVPVGIPGQLYASGHNLARGYYKQPQLTHERFIVNPFGAGRLYKTGDLARWLPDGNIEYLGRIDQQVKIRGFRIELGEIESVLSQHPAVQEAVVIAREDTPGDKRLVAYVVPDKETRRQGDGAERNLLVSPFG